MGITWDTIGRELFPDKTMQLVEIQSEAPESDSNEETPEWLQVPARVSLFSQERLLPFLGSHPEVLEFGAPRQKRAAIIRSAGIGDHIMTVCP